MHQSSTVFFYSKFKPLEIRSGNFTIYLQGKPNQLKNTKSSEDWIKEVKKSLKGSNLRPEVVLTRILKNSTGLFSLVLKSENEWIIAGDVIRSYPLFYGFHHNKLFITDNLEEFQKENRPLAIDYERFEEFFVTGLVYGNKTIYKNVYGLQAGEIISIHDNDINSERYFVFEPVDKPIYYDDLDEFTKAFDNLFMVVFSRMIKQNPHVNRWVIPLSGGHDSRLIVNYLYRLGVKNVICFSYGTPNNEQARISKQVAEAVGYDWYFIEYTEQKWKALHDSGLFDDYISFAFNGVSTPHLQDFLAVYELKRQGIIDIDDIILPGHSVVTVDVFDENTLKLKTEEESLNYVYSKIKTMTNKSRKEVPIHMVLRNMYYESKTTPENFMAFCDWQERQSKYITNSIRVYEFFGFETIQPMWDKEMVDFWLSIPAEERVSREPLYHTEKQCALVEQLACIPYANENHKFLLSIISKKLIPNYLAAVFLRLTRRRVKLNEGLNLIYDLKAKTVKNLLDPVEDFPQVTVPYFKRYFLRHTYQMDPYILTTLYTLRNMIDRRIIL